MRLGQNFYMKIDQVAKAGEADPQDTTVFEACVLQRVLEEIRNGEKGGITLSDLTKEICPSWSRTMEIHEQRRLRKDDPDCEEIGDLTLYIVYLVHGYKFDNIFELNKLSNEDPNFVFTAYGELRNLATKFGVKHLCPQAKKLLKKLLSRIQELKRESSKVAGEQIGAEDPVESRFLEELESGFTQPSYNEGWCYISDYPTRWSAGNVSESVSRESQELIPYWRPKRWTYEHVETLMEL